MTALQLLLLSVCAGYAVACGGGSGGGGGSDGGGGSQGCSELECDFEEGSLCESYFTYGCPAKPKRSKQEMKQYYSAIEARMRRLRARAKRSVSAIEHFRAKRGSGSGSGSGEGNGCPDDGEPENALLKSFVVTKVTHTYANEDGESGNHHLAAALLPKEAAYAEIAIEEPLPSDILIEMDAYVTSTDVEVQFCCGATCEDISLTAEKWQRLRLECNAGEQLFSLTATNTGKEPHVCAIDNVKVTAGLDCEEEE